MKIVPKLPRVYWDNIRPLKERTSEWVEELTGWGLPDIPDDLYVPTLRDRYENEGY